MIARPFHLIVLLLGVIAGVALGPASEHLSRSDVLTPVLAVGVALPAGWIGYDALRRR